MRSVTTNVSFVLLDDAVIGGRGDDLVVPAMTHARLLEEVAALGGVLHHLGVGVGVPVVIDLESDLDAVVAALAAARLGGVVTTRDDPAAPVVVASAASEVPGDGRNRILRGDDVAEPDLEWAAMIRAGRTDPAAVEVLDPGSAYSPERSVAEQIEALRGSVPPYDAAQLRRLLQV
jgi:acyl-CoA synthetase (AMP-forming)/AMP-acid ligase II